MTLSVADTVAAASAHLGAGKSGEAAVLLDAALAAAPQDVNLLHLRGLAAAQGGDAALSLDYFGRALRQVPGHPAILQNRAISLYRLGRLAEALADFDAVIARQPLPPNLARYRAACLAALGRLAEARTLYLALLPALAGDGETLANLATVELRLGQELATQGRPEEALAVFDATAGRGKENPALARHRAPLLVQLGRYEEALPLLDALIAADPADAASRGNRGAALEGLDRLEEALADCQAALALQDDNAVFHRNLANVLRRLDRPEEALAAAERAVALAPASAEAHDMHGIVLQGLKRYGEAHEAHVAALRLEPRRLETLRNLGVCLFERGLMFDALDAQTLVLKQAPDDFNTITARAMTLFTIGRTEEAITALDRALELQPGSAPAESNRLFFLSHLTGSRSHDVLEAARRWHRRHIVEAGIAPLPQGPARPALVTGRRLRIGYISPDFHHHAVSSFMLPLLEAHDRQVVEVFGYANVGAPDRITQACEAASEHWRSVHGLTTREMADVIAADGLDILVDLAGHTRNNVLPVFGYRPAPVQATYLGYFATTGMPEIDYWITDEMLHPADTAEQTVEKIWRLPRCYVAYRPLKATPPLDGAPPRDPGQPVTFGSFNAARKIGAETVALWAGVLRAVPGSQLLLKSGSFADRRVGDDLRAAFAREDIDPARIVTLGQTKSYEDHLALYGRIDVALDTFPVTGATTTADTLWMGVPVVTLAGRSKVERMSATQLAAIGHEDWIAGSAAEFAAIAARLAGQVAALHAGRAALRQRFLASSLGDAAGIARALEAAYLDMASRAGL